MTEPQIPSAVPRRAAGKVATISAMVCGVSRAAPRPCTTLAAMSVVGPVARPQAALARVNRAVPAANRVR